MNGLKDRGDKNHVDENLSEHGKFVTSWGDGSLRIITSCNKEVKRNKSAFHFVKLPWFKRPILNKILKTSVQRRLQASIYLFSSATLVLERQHFSRNGLVSPELGKDLFKEILRWKAQCFFKSCFFQLNLFNKLSCFQTSFTFSS